MKIDLLGHLRVDSNRLFIIDIRKFVFDPAKYRELGLIINTNGLGNFPVYGVADDDKGGYGKSRIIIEIGPSDSGEGYPKYIAKNKHG